MDNARLALASISSVDQLAEARRSVRTWLADTLEAEFVHLIVLVMNEVLTNALVHGGQVALLSAELRDGVVRIEVRDRSLQRPEARDPHHGTPSGRGLRIITAVSDRWGVDPVDDGKIVWSEIAIPPTNSA